MQSWTVSPTISTLSLCGKVIELDENEKDLASAVSGVSIKTWRSVEVFVLDASVSVSVQSKFMSSADCSFFKCHESYIWIKIRVGHAVVNHAEYALILALIPHMSLYFPTPH